jgi:hypothetical protein
VQELLVGERQNVVQEGHVSEQQEKMVQQGQGKAHFPEQLTKIASYCTVYVILIK